MIFLDSRKGHIKIALQDHYGAMACYIRKKIGIRRTCKRANCQFCNTSFHSVAGLPQKLKDAFADERFLEDLICGYPNDLILYEEMLWEELFSGFNYDQIFSIRTTADWALNADEIEFKKIFEHYETDYINKVINYNWFTDLEPNEQYSTYHWSRSLKIRTCIYCNRQFTTTVTKKNDKKLLRPQLDHWFPQSKFPFLALSFYNLIPSCDNCNSLVKNAITLNLRDHTHPFVDKNQVNEFVFDYEFDKSINEFKILINPVKNTNLRAADTVGQFKIDYIYNTHIEELKDLIRLRQAYSRQYIDKIVRLIPNNRLTEEEIYRMLFGVELKPENFHKRPLSKFKKDILVKLGIIK